MFLFQDQQLYTQAQSQSLPPREQQPSLGVFKNRQSREVSYRNLRDTDGIVGSASRAFGAQQRISSAKPGKVVGPVMPYENGSNVKDAYDPRIFAECGSPSLASNFAVLFSQDYCDKAKAREVISRDSKGFDTNQSASSPVQYDG